MSKYQATTHVTYNIGYHVVFCPKYRYNLLRYRAADELKGYSSYYLRKQFAYLRKYPSLWTRSYFVETVGHISEKTVVHYIESQKSKARSSPG